MNQTKSRLLRTLRFFDEALFEKSHNITSICFNRSYWAHRIFFQFLWVKIHKGRIRGICVVEFWIQRYRQWRYLYPISQQLPTNTNQELLSAKSISAEITPKTIFSTPLNIIEIALDRPHLNYFIPDGEDLMGLFKRNAVVESNRANADLPFAEYNVFNPFEIVDNDELRIQKILVKDGSVDWKNIQKKSQRELRQINLTIEKIDENSKDIFIRGSSKVKTYVDLLKNTSEWPFTFSTEIRKNFDQNTVELRNIKLGITPLLVSGGITFNPGKY